MTDQTIPVAEYTALRAENEKLREALYAILGERDPAVLRFMLSVVEAAGEYGAASAIRVLLEVTRG